MILKIFIRSNQSINLVIISYMQSKNDPIICGVCLDIIRMEDGKKKIKLLECGHPMHTVCFDQMMIYRHHSCPLCRRGILSNFARFQMYLYHNCAILWLFYTMRFCLIVFLTIPLFIVFFAIQNNTYRIITGSITFMFWIFYWSIIFYLDYQSIRTSI